jgi:hypothetical protein
MYIQEASMAGTPKGARAASKAGGRKQVATPKKSKTYRLSESKIAAAQEILGAKTATAAIEAALDMVVFRKELVDGAAALRGLEVEPFNRA